MPINHCKAVFFGDTSFWQIIELKWTYNQKRLYRASLNAQYAAEHSTSGNSTKTT
jgi:hypothetical protein